MCFSAEVSFTAAAVLTVVGYRMMKMSHSKPQMLFAALPLLLAFQQALEGVLWLYLQNDAHPTFMSTAAHYLYLAFVFIVWPIWFPLSIALLEKIPWRQKLIGIAVVGGAVFAGSCLTYLPHQNLVVEIVDNSIQYQAEPYIAGLFFQKVYYGLVIIIPCFFSSLRGMPLFGAFLAGALVIAQYFYCTTFASVWCFFAAALSVWLYKILKDNFPAQ